MKPPFAAVLLALAALALAPVLAGDSFAQVDDRDGDGIADNLDPCPGMHATHGPDGVEGGGNDTADGDGNGCPDFDNDGDVIPGDGRDRCPNLHATFGPDGAEGGGDDTTDTDTNGCPDNDPDGDGVTGDDDKCPNSPRAADNKRNPDDGCAQAVDHHDDLFWAAVDGGPITVRPLLNDEFDASTSPLRIIPPGGSTSASDFTDVRFGTLTYTGTPSDRISEMTFTPRALGTAEYTLRMWTQALGTLGSVDLRINVAMADADFDRVPDSTDDCPGVRGWTNGELDADENGCPDSDNDGDGIATADDSCPDVHATAGPDGDPMETDDNTTDENGDGCPDTDADGDGIPDHRDACPGEASMASNDPDGDGCPNLDSDGDGIPDLEDLCPGEAPLVPTLDTDLDGCTDQVTDNYYAIPIEAVQSRGLVFDPLADDPAAPTLGLDSVTSISFGESEVFTLGDDLISTLVYETGIDQVGTLECNPETLVCGPEFDPVCYIADGICTTVDEQVPIYFDFIPEYIEVFTIPADNLTYRYTTDLGILDQEYDATAGTGIGPLNFTATVQLGSVAHNPVNITFDLPVGDDILNSVTTIYVTDPGDTSTFDSRLVGGMFSTAGPSGKHAEFAMHTALGHLNRQLFESGEYLVYLDIRDTMGDQRVAEEHLADLAVLADLINGGTSLVAGPPDSDMLGYLNGVATDNNLDMTFVSPASTAPALAKDDNVYRLIPSDAQTGSVTASMLYADGKRAIIPVYVDNAFGHGMASSTIAEFERLGGQSYYELPEAVGGEEPYAAGNGIFRYMPCQDIERDAGCNNQFGPMAGDLNGAVVEMTRIHGADRVAVLYIGPDSPYFVSAAIIHDPDAPVGTTPDPVLPELALVQWAGSAPDVLLPELVNGEVLVGVDEDLEDDAAAARLDFAEAVNYWAAAPEIVSDTANFELLESALESRFPGETPANHVHAAYDSVWHIGLALVESGFTPETADLAAQIDNWDDGALGDVTLDENGDIAASDTAVYGIAGGGWGRVGTYTASDTFEFDPGHAGAESGVRVGAMLDLPEEGDLALVMKISEGEPGTAELETFDTGAGALPAFNEAYYGGQDDIMTAELRAGIRAAIDAYDQSAEGGFDDINGEFGGQAYPFVVNDSGALVAHGRDASAAGTPVTDLIRNADRTPAEVFAALAAAGGPGHLWWQYETPVPGAEDRYQTTRSLMVYHADSDTVIGAGYVPSEWSEAELRRNIAIARAAYEASSDDPAMRNFEAINGQHAYPEYPFVVARNGTLQGHGLAGAAVGGTFDVLVRDADRTIPDAIDVLKADNGVDELWMQYRSPPPAQADPPGSSHITKRSLLVHHVLSDGTDAVIGAGYHPTFDERTVELRRGIQAAVDAYEASDADESARDFADINGMHPGEGYPFVIGDDGMLVAHGRGAPAAGTPVTDIIRNADRTVAEAFAELTAEDGVDELWWHYEELLPGTTNDPPQDSDYVPKRSLLVYHEPSDTLVGSGYGPRVAPVEYYAGPLSDGDIAGSLGFIGGHDVAVLPAASDSQSLALPDDNIFRPYPPQSASAGRLLDLYVLAGKSEIIIVHPAGAYGEYYRDAVRAVTTVPDGRVHVIPEDATGAQLEQLAADVEASITDASGGTDYGPVGVVFAGTAEQLVAIFESPTADAADPDLLKASWFGRQGLGFDPSLISPDTAPEAPGRLADAGFAAVCFHCSPVGSTFLAADLDRHMIDYLPEFASAHDAVRMLGDAFLALDGGAVPAAVTPANVRGHLGTAVLFTGDLGEYGLDANGDLEPMAADYAQAQIIHESPSPPEWFRAELAIAEDMDGDGVPDAIDSCPDTHRNDGNTTDGTPNDNTAVDTDPADGCPDLSVTAGGALDAETDETVALMPLEGALGHGVTVASVDIVPDTAGSVSPTSGTGTFTFTPTTGHDGLVTVTFDVEDSQGNAGMAVFPITYSDPTVTPDPVPVDDTATVQANDSVDITPLVNDTGDNPSLRDPTTYPLAGDFGTLNFVDSTTLRYTAGGAAGTDTFTIPINLGGQQLTSMLTVTVTAAAPGPDGDGDGVPDSEDQCPNTPAGEAVNAQGCIPPNAADDSVSTTRADPVIISPLENDAGEDGSLVSVSPPAGDHGTILRLGDTLAYNPEGSTIGTDTFTVTVMLSGQTLTSTLTVEVTDTDGDGDGVGDLVDRCPDEAAATDADSDGCTDAVILDDSATIVQGEEIVLDPLDNDTGTDLSVTNITFTPAGAGTLERVPNTDMFTFASAADFVGTVTFTVSISDGPDITDLSSSLVLTVDAAPPGPHAMNDVATVTSLPGESVTIMPLANDRGDNPSVTSVDPPAGACGTLARSGDTLTYTPDEGGSCTETFTITVSLGGETFMSTLTIAVMAPPDGDGDGVYDANDRCPDTPAGSAVNADGCIPPVANDDPVSTPRNAALDISPLENDEGELKSIPDTFAGQTGSHGTLSRVDGQTLRYAPEGSTIGTDTFTITVSLSGQEQQSSVVVTVTDTDADEDGVLDLADACPGVHATAGGNADTNGNGCPDGIHDDTATTEQGTAVELDPLANDDPVDQQVFSVTGITFVPVNAGALGEVTTGPGPFTFTPADRFVGDVTFTFAISDGTVTDLSSDLLLTVNPRDSDGDGVYDNDDRCPDEGGRVDANGCPVRPQVTPRQTGGGGGGGGSGNTNDPRVCGAQLCSEVGRTAGGGAAAPRGGTTGVQQGTPQQPALAEPELDPEPVREPLCPEGTELVGGMCRAAEPPAAEDAMDGMTDNMADDIVDDAMDGSMEGSMDGSMEGSMDDSMNGSMNDSMEGSMDGSMDDSMDRPADPVCAAGTVLADGECVLDEAEEPEDDSIWAQLGRWFSSIFGA